MPVDVTENYIRVRVKDPSLFIDGSFRTITLSAERGIKSIIGKLRSDPEGSTKIQAYLFDKEKWTSEQAQAWVKENGEKAINSLLLLYKEQEISEKRNNKVIKYARVKVVHIDEDKKIAVVQVTTEDIDRDREINLLTSWKKNIKYYKEHPVLLSSHKYDSLTHVIGEAVSVDADKMQFGFKWYAGEGNPEADWGWTLAKKGMAMFSVGYIPLSVMEGDAIPEKLREKEPRRVYTENELLEVSQVVIGSNRGALQLGLENPSPEHLQYAFDIVKGFGQEIPDFSLIKEPAPAPIKEEKKEERIESDSIIISPIEVKNMKELEDIFEIYKSGRVISEKNKTILKSAIESMQKAVDALNQLIELVDPKEEGGEGEKEVERLVSDFISRGKKNLNLK